MYVLNIKLYNWIMKKLYSKNLYCFGHDFTSVYIISKITIF